MGTTFIAFIIVLGVLIFFHELGHFLVARLCGVGVEKFSLGFGPRLFGKKSGITDYRVSAIPLGGYVKMVGDEPDAEVEPDLRHLSFTHKSVTKRILIVAAGPLFNLLLAVLIFLGINLIHGAFIPLPTVGNVTPRSPAQEAGIEPGDRIVSIDGYEVATWDDMKIIISESGGKSLSIIVDRDGEPLSLEISPDLAADKNIFGEDVERYVIGITSSGDGYTKELSLIEASKLSLYQTYNVTKLTIVSVAKIIQGKISTKNLGGPIMIAEMAGQQAKEGTLNLVFFIALLSINLAILNFLPIPVLDGGHLLFFFIEAVIRRPINQKLRETAQQAGIFILILLMIFVFYNDISRIFFS
jgi:regulator of sigma E protease